MILIDRQTTLEELLNEMLLHQINNTEINLEIARNLYEIGKNTNDVVGYNIAIYIAPIYEHKK